MPTASVVWSVSPGSPAGFRPGNGGFIPTTAPTTKGSSSWQTSRPPTQGTSWSPHAKPPSKACAQPRPNYATSFSVIGGREERGVRAPSFGEFSFFFLCIVVGFAQLTLRWLKVKSCFVVFGSEADPGKGVVKPVGLFSDMSAGVSSGSCRQVPLVLHPLLSILANGLRDPVFSSLVFCCSLRIVASSLRSAGGVGGKSLCKKFVLFQLKSQKSQRTILRIYCPIKASLPGLTRRGQRPSQR